MKEFSMGELSAKGDEVHSTACAGCHQVNDQGGLGAFQVLTSNLTDVGWIAAHTDIVVKGKSGTAMQEFKEKVSSVDLAAFAKYQLNELGNLMDDLVQPGAIR